MVKDPKCGYCQDIYAWPYRDKNNNIIFLCKACVLKTSKDNIKIKK